MFVNTNDAFTGLTPDPSMLNVGDSVTLSMPIWDAGTEANTEEAMTIPVQQVEGFNASREIRDTVAYHPELSHPMMGLRHLFWMFHISSIILRILITRTE